MTTRPTHVDASDKSTGWTIAYWLCQVFGWGSYVALGLAMTIPQTGAQPSIVGGYVLFFFYSIALTHGLRGIIRRQNWFDLTPDRAARRLIAGVVAVGTIQTVLIVLVGAVWTQQSLFAVSARFVVVMWANTTGASIVWTAAYSGLSALQRIRRARQIAVEMELGMREARLRSLEAQLNPHFLFNCLNSVRGLIVENPPRAQDMVTRLANILRHNLVHRAETTESLADQVAFITDYLELESIRLEERLRTRLAIDPATNHCQVPWMLLQTLVENAIKHGIAQLPQGGEIVVESHLRDGLLEIVVENSGTLSPSPAGSTRVGLANLRERLRLLHGPAASLELLAPAADRVRAIARIPLSQPLANSVVPAQP